MPTPKNGGGEILISLVLSGWSGRFQAGVLLFDENSPRKGLNSGIYLFLLHICSFCFKSLSFASDVWLLSQHPDPRDKRTKQGKEKLAFRSLSVPPHPPVKKVSQPGKG